MRLPCLALCLSLAWVPLGQAANIDVPLEAVQPEPESDRLDVDGLVLDRTFTRFGQGFYNEFTRLRSDEDPDAQENLTIHERPTARWGSLIWITHNRKVIFKTALSPGRNQQEQSAKLAWSQVRQTLEQQKIATLFMDTFDLEHDEL
ncbi:CsgE [Aeromonas sobria]|uniref:Curli production assembly/transport component CsgE n=1 Tax=Aeromonas sobria TaxID=646 RepID=A0A2N3IPI6_AERSO|nr:curli production assembly/transport protein CsgE [Aeromonas sobria]PKQ73188.1 CsgE [Aeromonas sobria]